MLTIPSVAKLRHEGWSNEVANSYRNYCYSKMRKQGLKQVGCTASTDSQREKFYASEFEFMAEVPNMVVFESLEEVRKFVKKVTKSKLWQDIKLHKVSDFIAIGTTKANCHAWARPGEIMFNMDYPIDIYTVLHELCHCAGYLNHDVGFRIALRRLVSRYMGQETRRLWTNVMKKNKIKLRYPSTETKPIEEWYTMYMKTKAMRKKL